MKSDEQETSFRSVRIDGYPFPAENTLADRSMVQTIEVKVY